MSGCLPRGLANADKLRANRALTADDTADKPVPDQETRVLLIEDNPVNQEVAMLILSEIGCHTEIAADGRAGLHVYQEAAYDLVLMDCQMPNMDGFAATRAIREWERRMGKSATPIIALTANTLKDDRERCLAAGMNGYLSKPLSIHKLKNIMANYLNSLPGGANDEPRAYVSTAAEAPQTVEATASVIDISTMDALQDKLIAEYHKVIAALESESQRIPA